MRVHITRHMSGTPSLCLHFVNLEPVLMLLMLGVSR